MAWRTWVGRIAFGLSVLALLGTSLPRWEVAGKIEGPDRAPSEDQAIRLTIEASYEPRYTFATGASPYVEGRRCTSGWSREKNKIECLLPPGAQLKTVAISEKCRGGGCCSNEPCKPPPDAVLKAKTEAVPIWKHIVEKEARLHVMRTVSKDGGRTVVQYLEVEIESVVPNTEVTFRGKEQKGTVAGWSGAETTLDCRLFTPDAGKPIECTSWALSNDTDKAVELDVIVKAFVYGACDTLDGGPCTPPPDAAALRILHVAMKGD